MRFMYLFVTFEYVFLLTINPQTVAACGFIKRYMILKKIVGMIRLELTTTRPPDVYANQLRYIPMFCGINKFILTKRMQRYKKK